MKLAILHNATARRLVTREFVRGDKDRYSEEELAPYIVALPRTIEAGLLTTQLRTRLSGAPQDPKIDLGVAILLHKSLRLTRREAAQNGLWSYFAIAVLPELVRHRWDTDQTTTRDRFWRPGTRPDSNYYGRLWWMAELTSEQGSYELTKQVFDNQSLAKSLFVRKLSHHRPAIRACVKILGRAGSARVEAAIRDLQKRLSVYPLAALSENDLIHLLKTLQVVGEAGTSPQ